MLRNRSPPPRRGRAKEAGSKVKKKVIRVGMKVRHIYNDPTNEFVIVESRQPQRIFRAKGTKAWYAKVELEPVSAAKRTPGAKRLKQAARDRSQAFLGVAGGLSPKAKPSFKRSCPECGIEFVTENKRQKFCIDAHRTANWKRRNEIPELPKQHSPRAADLKYAEIEKITRPGYRLRS